MLRYIFDTSAALMDEFRRQRDIANEIFTKMERGGLHALLEDIGRTPNRSPIQEEEPLPVYRQTPSPIYPIPVPLPTTRRSSPDHEPRHMDGRSLSPIIPIAEPTSTSPRTILPGSDLLTDDIFNSHEDLEQQEQHYAMATLGGTRLNPVIIVEESDSESDDDTFVTAPTTLGSQCWICLERGHSHFDCPLYLCDHCNMYAPGHNLADCFYNCF